MQRLLILPLFIVPLATGCVTGPTTKEIKQAEIQYDLGVNELSNGQFAAAMKSFLEVIRLNPEFAQAHNGLGLAYQMLGNQEKALAHYQRALELKPDYSEVRNNMARVYLNQGKFRQAIPLLKKALDDVFLKERYLAESNLGWALFNTGQEEEGFKHVRNSLAQNDGYCVGYEYLGLMQKARKNYEESIREFKELTKRCPKHLAGHQQLGKVLLMTGDLKNGCKALQTCKAASRMTDVGRECDRLFRENCPEEKKPPAAPSDG
jgi:Tfp pilus assembly protein PilF